MMKKYFAILLTLLCICLCFVPCNTVWADEPAATIIFSAPSVEIGEEITVTLRFKSSTANISVVDGYLTYDDSVLECISSTGVEGNLHILENATPSVDTLDIKLTFRALKANRGSTLTVSCDVRDEADVSIGTAAASAKLDIDNPTVALSSNANLASLSVSYGTLAPAFSSSITEYTVMVDNSVTKFPLSAKTEDDNATIAITGSQNLAVGMNQRVVTVTAQDGTQKIYTVTIVRAEPVQSATPEPGISSTPTKTATPVPVVTPPPTQIQWGTATPAQTPTANVEQSATPQGTAAPTPTATSTPASTPSGGMSVNELKNTVLIVLVILAVIVIVILFTVVYCMQQKDQKKRGGKSSNRRSSRSKNSNRNRR